MKISQKLKSSKYYRFRLAIENILDKTIGIFLFQYQRRDNMFNWFYNCLKYQNIDNPDYSPKYNYYEFGVAGGGSMKVYILALKKFCRDFNQDINKFHIFGFDSFAGLPEAKKEDKRHDWSAGEFRHDKEIVLKMIDEVGFPMKNLHLMEGFFEDTLTEKLKEKLKKSPPSIVNMDEDYYSSTMTAFGWMADFLPSGSLFRFDNIWSFYGHPEKGELKAIKDFNSLGKGYLTPFPVLGLDGYAYVFCRKDFEYV